MFDDAAIETIKKFKRFVQKHYPDNSTENSTANKLQIK
jgi:hypothetical protein